jgi:aspartyl protease family protein
VNFKTLGVSLVWLLLASGLFYFFDAKVHPNTADKLSDGPEVRLVRDLSGHYRAEAFINGVKTSILIDTGASDVSISRRFAERLGITSNAAVRTQTANGATVGYMTRLDSVKLGGIEERNVAAIIVNNPGADMLLGMSFLNRMDVRLHQGIMTIRSAVPSAE